MLISSKMWKMSLQDVRSSCKICWNDHRTIQSTMYIRWKRLQRSNTIQGKKSMSKNFLEFIYTRSIDRAYENIIQNCTCFQNNIVIALKVSSLNYLLLTAFWSVHYFYGYLQLSYLTISIVNQYKYIWAELRSETGTLITA